MARTEHPGKRQRWRRSTVDSGEGGEERGPLLPRGWELEPHGVAVRPRWAWKVVSEGIVAIGARRCSAASPAARCWTRPEDKGCLALSWGGGGGTDRGGLRARWPPAGLDWGGWEVGSSSLVGGIESVRHGKRRPIGSPRRNPGVFHPGGGFCPRTRMPLKTGEI